MHEKYDHHKNGANFAGAKHVLKTTYPSNPKKFLDSPPHK